MTTQIVLVDVDPDRGHLRGRIFQPGDKSIVERKAQLVGIPAPGFSMKPAGRAEPAPVGDPEPALDDQ